MIRATLVKLAFVAAAVVAWLALPEGIRGVGVATVVGGAIVFFAVAVTSPRAQFLVPSVFRFSSESPAVAFTFDDGPDPTYTPKVLDLLARYGAHATFFVVGNRARSYPELVRRAAAEGHAIGSHTFDHRHTFHFRSQKHMRAEVERGVRAVADLIGTRPRLFRPPQGLRTPMLRDALDGGDLVCVTWSARGMDAVDRSASRIVKRLEPAMKPGSILCLHDGRGFGGTAERGATLEALERLLELAKERNLRCVALEPSGSEVRAWQ